MLTNEPGPSSSWLVVKRAHHAPPAPFHTIARSALDMPAVDDAHNDTIGVPEHLSLHVAPGGHEAA